mmetsp:Transcript_25139/g.44828  ORF Transcript_25139/g.44828 Transcript_25139/m.44828 type:complete len:147 (-) Transcript_25139:311-751(-)
MRNIYQKRQTSVRSGISKASGAKADILYEPGDVITVGSLELKVLPTPGHTSGCVSYYTAAAGGMVFTGDALLVRGCGRTDFQQGAPHTLPAMPRVFHPFAGSSETLYKSVHEQLFTLPDDTTARYLTYMLPAYFMLLPPYCESRIL